jgi:hypothetical protein
MGEKPAGRESRKRGRPADRERGGLPNPGAARRFDMLIK